MISKLGVIYQDINSLGFLQGLQQRLKCEAELVRSNTTAGRSQYMTSAQARQAWNYFQNQGVDAVIRLTDADLQPWQEVKRTELKVFPKALRNSHLLVCGVAVNNTEEWLALDAQDLARRLGQNATRLPSGPDRTDVVKKWIRNAVEPGRTKSEVVRRLVLEAESNVFKAWLRDESFRDFYQECRNLAERFNCDTPNEM